MGAEHRHGLTPDRSSERKPGVGLTLGALGVVYGDIGTSPIYALRECFKHVGTGPASADDILGLISLITWSLIVTVSLKYLLFIMRADNKGEGGIIALIALLNPWRSKQGSSRWILMLLGLFGGALLYGDGSITPAISVLSAIEGVNVAAPALSHFVVPITLAILIAIFVIQHKGTASIGRIFGPLMVLWFVTIGLLGVVPICRNPEVLVALNPYYAAHFFAHKGFDGYLILGAVFLSITGAEALYADMGHFGRRPIQLAWFAIVLPCLLLNYFGQGALVLQNPTFAAEPFYRLAPDWALFPMIGLATLATIIASQAVISGVFSMTRQLVRLGQLPRMHIVQTSADEHGQVYIPFANWCLMYATLALVVGFRSSDALASAYGIAVSLTMVITTILAFFVARRYGRSATAAGIACLIFISIDLVFFGANLFKIADGGWFPLVAAAGVFFLMRTWAIGRRLVTLHWDTEAKPIDTLIDEIRKTPPIWIEGTAVFFTEGGKIAPHIFRHLKRHHVLQRKLVLLTVRTEPDPWVPVAERLEVAGLTPKVTRVTVHHGFMQDANVPLALHQCARLGLEIDMKKVSYYVGRETLVPCSSVKGMWLWRERLFSFLSSNAMRATEFYHLPTDDVVELGFQVEI